MADLSDASRALVALIAQTVYPNGTGQPPVGGAGVRVYAGWPMPAQLDADLPQNIINISVFPRAVKPVDNAISKWRTVSPPLHTITMTVVGQVVTVGGSVSTPQNVALVIDGKAYVYSVQAGDTLTGIATALAAQIVADFPGTTSSGPVITISQGVTLVLDFVNQVYQSDTLRGASISPRVGGAAMRQREVRRQDQEFLITVWANSYDSRDLLGGAVDSALAGINRITLPDSSFGTLRSRALSNSWDDGTQKQRIYRRDLACWIEYSTTVLAQQYEVTQVQVDIESDAPAVIKTIYM